MKKSIFAALAVFLISGYIGFSTNYVNTSKASENVIVMQPLQLPLPQQKNPGFNVDLDLNKQTAQIIDNDYGNVKINITREDSVVHDTLYVPKKVPYKVKVEKLIPIRVTPSYAKVHRTPVVLASMANSYLRILLLHNH